MFRKANVQFIKITTLLSRKTYINAKKIIAAKGSQNPSVVDDQHDIPVVLHAGRHLRRGQVYLSRDTILLHTRGQYVMQMLKLLVTSSIKHVIIKYRSL